VRRFIRLTIACGKHLPNTPVSYSYIFQIYARVFVDTRVQTIFIQIVSTYEYIIEKIKHFSKNSWICHHKILKYHHTLFSGAFSEGATAFLTRMAKIKFPTPISSGSLSYLPVRQRWIDWHMHSFSEMC
jgi:hypothetical protein